MIISAKGKNGIVLGFDSNNSWYCAMNEDSCLERFDAQDFEVKNHKIPPDWTISRYFYSSFKEIPSWLDSEYNDYIFFCHPISISPCSLLECTYYTEVKKTGVISIHDYIVLKAINDVRTFHRLDNIAIQYIDEYENILMTPEQRRLKKIEDELNEGLKLLKQDDE